MNDEEDEEGSDYDNDVSKYTKKSKRIRTKKTKRKNKSPETTALLLDNHGMPINPILSPQAAMAGGGIYPDMSWA